MPSFAYYDDSVLTVSDRDIGDALTVHRDIGDDIGDVFTVHRRCYC